MSPPELRLVDEDQRGLRREYTFVPHDASEEAARTTWLTVAEDSILDLDDWR